MANRSVSRFLGRSFFFCIYVVRSINYIRSYRDSCSNDNSAINKKISISRASGSVQKIYADLNAAQVKKERLLARFIRGN